MVFVFVVVVLRDGDEGWGKGFAVAYERGIGLDDDIVAGAVGGYGGLLAPGVELWEGREGGFSWGGRRREGKWSGGGDGEEKGGREV